MDFGKALDALKGGKKVAREGWNGKGMFIFLTKGRTINNDGERSFKHFEDLPEVTLADHIDMRDAQGSYISGWLASQTDMLAEDWHIVE